MFNSLSLGWISRDAWLIISARGLRTFGLSYISVILALYLEQLGFNLLQIGAFLSTGVAGIACFAVVTGLIAGKVRRKAFLIVFALISAVCAVALLFTDSFVVLLVIAFFGALTGGGGGGETPAQPIEQASLPDTAPDEKRTDLFAVYGIVARFGIALGALAAGLPALYQGPLGLSTISAYRVMFVGYSVLQLTAALFYSVLSSNVEGQVTGQRWSNPFRLPSRRLIFTLNGLFSLDHFAGSMVTQSLVAYFFATRFGIQLGSLALVFFLSNSLTAVSLWLAAKLANRIGLLNTMVFSHLPSNIFLILVPLAPFGWLAVMFWQLRSFLGQMDVPTRESYTMAVVGTEERVAMASVHVVARSISGTVGPSVATSLWSALSATTPIALAGVLKCVYDLSLYGMFRKVRPPEETRADQQEEEMDDQLGQSGIPEPE